MKIIGHRGARGLAPENTIASLGKALEHKVDQIEFDVRVTKDSIAILIHDPELRDASGSFTVANHTYSELKEHKTDLCTLEEALKYIDAKAVVYVEVKPSEPIEPIVAVLQQFLDDAYGLNDLLLGSKSQKTLRALHRALPDVPTIVIEPWSGARAHYRARQVGTKKVAMNERWLWSGFIKPMRNRGWELYPYTVNDKAKAQRWERWGIAGIVTDYPDRFER